MSKPEIREQIGVAVNASRLVLENHETAVDRVAALGAATRCVQLGADRVDLPIAAVEDQHVEQDYLAGDLGALLWRIRYGQQYELVGQAIELLCRWIGHRRMFAESEEATWILEPFAVRLVHEWLSDKCRRCGGTGLLERSGNGGLIMARGRARNAAFATCDHCQGTKRAQPSDTERCKALGMPRHWYFKLGWPRRFSTGRAWLDQLSRRISRPLTEELGRRIRRPAATRI